MHALWVMRGWLVCFVLFFNLGWWEQALFLSLCEYQAISKIYSSSTSNLHTHTHTHTQYWSCTPILKLYTQGGPTHTHPQYWSRSLRFIPLARVIYAHTHTQYWSRSLRFIPLARVIYTHTHTHTHTQYWSRSLRFIPLAQVIHTHTHTHTHTILKLYTNTEAIYSRRALCRSLEFFLCSSLFSSTLCWEKVDLINN